MAGQSCIRKRESKTQRTAIIPLLSFRTMKGITHFANTLTDKKTDNIPTCGVFAVKIKSKHWKDFGDAKKEFWFFDYPKADEKD
jgi:hypothetical protein